MTDVSVAIPVRDGGQLFAELLDALSRQTVAHELIVCDSSVALARSRGARVLESEPERFSHGGTRNLLIEASAGTHVALLTQDSVPAGERWLQALLDGFSAAADVARLDGAHHTHPRAPIAVRRELEAWFDSLAGDGSVQVERLDERERASLPASE